MTAPHPPAPCTVLVVEDDPRTRRYLADGIVASPRLELVGQCGSVAEVRQWLAAAARMPDVLLTDLGLPDGSGIEVIREVRARHPACEPLVISMFSDEEHVLASIEAGALGYIHKDSTPEGIAQTVLELRAGGSPISPGIARRLLLRQAGASAQPVAGAGAPAPASAEYVLSPREAEILNLLSRGFSYNEIADLVGLSRHTVASHVKSLYRKMQVGSRSEAVFEALQSGVLQAPR